MTTGQVSDDRCLTLALEGERLCRTGNFRQGIVVFLQALHAGTVDISVLSAIYIQLGNAYFYLEDFEKALDYHTKDLSIARSSGNERNEARASGNIATTLKSLGQYDEAIAFAQQQLDLYRKLRADDKAIGRALYNLASTLHGRCKATLTSSNVRSGKLSKSIENSLLLAADFYLENYSIAKEMLDLVAQGRVCGNLGNVYYLLGDFPQALLYHQQRLILARECKDTSAERRAYTNLGNCHIFLGHYEKAAECYLKSLSLVERSEKALEAQTCYSLANTYSLMRNYDLALQFYSRHLLTAKSLGDVVGEGRAYWSLAAACSASGLTDEAIKYAKEHLRVAEQIGDSTGILSARTNLIAYTRQADAASGSSSKDGARFSQENIAAQIRRISMEHMDLLRLTPEIRVFKPDNLRLISEKETSIYQSNPNFSWRLRGRSPSIPQAPVSSSATSSPKRHSLVSDTQTDWLFDEDFFDILSRTQGKRLDDQRCCLDDTKENRKFKNGRSSTGARASSRSVSTREELMDYIAIIQSKRLDEQRAELPFQSEATSARSYSVPLSTHHIFIQDYPPTAQDYRKILSTLPENCRLAQLMAANNTATSPPGSKGAGRNREHALPDSFFDMLMKHQGARMEDQRASVSLSSTPRVSAVPLDDSSKSDTKRPPGPKGDDKPDPSNSSTKPKK